MHNAIQQLDEIPFWLELQSQLGQVVAVLRELLLRLHQVADPTDQAHGFLVSCVFGLIEDGRNHPPVQADRIASAILFLASDEASFITGAALVADGGLTAQTGLPPFVVR